MKKISKIIAYAFLFVILLNSASAFMYHKDDYDMLGFMGMPYFGLFAGLGLLALAAVAFLFVFWIWMLVDCIKRDFKKDVEKIVWILVLIFLHLLGALIYYFVVKISEKKVLKKK